MLRQAPDDKQALAYQATAWRLLGDPRYGERYDYAALVRAWTLDTPKGWSRLDAYLADLAALNDRHRLHTHLLDQSLRQGSQVSHVLAIDHPAINGSPRPSTGRSAGIWPLWDPAGTACAGSTPAAIG